MHTLHTCQLSSDKSMSDMSSVNSSTQLQLPSAVDKSRPHTSSVNWLQCGGIIIAVWMRNPGQVTHCYTTC